MQPFLILSTFFYTLVDRFINFMWVEYGVSRITVLRLSLFILGIMTVLTHEPGILLSEVMIMAGAIGLYATNELFYSRIEERPQDNAEIIAKREMPTTLIVNAVLVGICIGSVMRILQDIASLAYIQLIMFAYYSFVTKSLGSTGMPKKNPRTHFVPTT